MLFADIAGPFVIRPLDGHPFFPRLSLALYFLSYPFIHAASTIHNFDRSDRVGLSLFTDYFPFQFLCCPSILNVTLCCSGEVGGFDNLDRLMSQHI